MTKPSIIQRSFQKISQAANSKTVRRGVLAALIAASSLNAISNARANEVLLGGISILVHEFRPADATETKPVVTALTETASTAITASQPIERIASLGTHDSIAIVPPPIEVIELVPEVEIDRLELADTFEFEEYEIAGLANVVELEEPVLESESSQFNQTIAAAVVASAAKLGISIEQVLEPFVMIGSFNEDAPQTMPMDAFYSGLEELAAQAVETAAIDSADYPIGGEEKLTGSSAMIVTIEDAYMPYDFAQRDLELNFLPLSTVLPISPKNYVESAAQEVVPPAPELVAAVVTTPVEEISEEAKTEASPERLLSELIHDASQLADATQVRDMTFASLGESFGDWVASLSPKRAALAKSVAPAAVVGSALLAISEVADVPASAPESTVVAVDVADEEAVTQVAELAMMEVDGQAIAAPVADPIPNAEEALEIAKTDSVPVMEVDGEIVPAPVADPAPNASDASGQIAVMEVEGKVIPAPVADPLPNAEPEQIASSKADADEMAVVEPAGAEPLAAEPLAVDAVAVDTVAVDNTVVEPAATEIAVTEIAEVQLGTPVVDEPEANIADLIATISQWQREAINEILASPVEVSSEVANSVASELATELASDDTKADVASPEASEAVTEVAEKVEAPGETKLR